VTVEPFDPHTADQADLAACHRIRASWVAAELPGDPVPTPEDTATWLTATTPDERRLLRAARVDGAVAAFSYVVLPVVENTGLGMVWMWVQPDRRRRGLGTELLADAVRVSQQDGRDTMLVEPAEGSPAAHFAEHFGFTVGQREVLSTLDLSTVDTDRLAAAATAEHHPYRLRSWTGAVPEDIVERYAVALNHMRDAPVGDLTYDSPQWTPERLRHWESWVDQRGREQLVTVAVHEPSGDVAGVTVVLVPRIPDGRAYQDDTTVVREHRGNGLGLWIKAAMARRLLAEHPQARSVLTGNAEENTHMRRINFELGFQVLRVQLFGQARVPDLAKQLGI
jgi:GNAT superfamily N-acetyltransferase